MKSITIKPPKSRKRNWRAISSAASKLVLSAVSSMSPPRVERDELISIAVNASVTSITIEPQMASALHVGMRTQFAIRFDNG